MDRVHGNRRRLAPTDDFRHWGVRRSSGIYVLTSLKFQPRGRDLDEFVPAMSVADATCDYRRVIEQLQ
jgi:hypothetical protein